MSQIKSVTFDPNELPPSFHSNFCECEDCYHEECSELEPVCQECMDAAEASYLDYLEAVATGN